MNRSMITLKQIIWSSGITKLFAFPILCLIVCGCATPSILVMQEQRKGDMYFNNHNYPEAAAHYLRMIDASKNLGIYRNLSMEADVRRKTANCFEMMGDYESALNHVYEAQKLDSLENNLVKLIEDYRQEGRIYIYMGFYTRGIPILVKSLTLSEGMSQRFKDENRLARADTYLTLGQLYAVMGRFSESNEYVLQAQNIYRRTGDKKGEMETSLALGSALADMGDLAAAHTLVTRSLEIADMLSMSKSRHYQLLASIQSASGNYEEAVRYQEIALNDARKFGIVGQIIWVTIGMGDIYRDLGDTKRAETYYHQARLTKESVEMKTGSLEASLNLRLGEVLSARNYFATENSARGGGIASLRLAEIMIIRNDHDSALVHIQQAENTFTQAGNRQGIVNAKLLKGKQLIGKSDFLNAKRALDSAALAEEYPETVWQAHFYSGMIYEHLNQDNNALESYRKSIAIIEKIRGNLTVDEFKSLFFDSKRDVYDRLINLLLKRNQAEEAFKYAEYARARSFYDMLANKQINFGGSVSGDLVLQEQQKRREIQKLYKLLQASRQLRTFGTDDSQIATGKDDISSSLTRAQEEYRELINQIRIKNPDYANILAVEPVELTDIQSKIDSNTAVLAYWAGDKKIITWLITQSAVETKIITIEKSNLESLITSARRSIQSLSNAETSHFLHELYEILIEPFESRLTPYSNLLILPNGPLHFLPYQALIDKEGRYLVQNFNLSYSPSAGVYIISTEKKVKMGSRFMGSALADLVIGNHAGLPGTRDELNRILKLFPDNITAVGKQSSETFVKQNVPDCNFIHIATHGIYNYNQPLYSHLLFPPSDQDDGRLNVFEVFEMNIDARLVTLSACETGMGNISKGDELTGLSRAFLYAGASSVIVSLWPVADHPTSILMSSFYGFLRNYSMQEALTLAQREVIKLYPQPIYWAPFILIGNGNTGGIQAPLNE